MARTEENEESSSFRFWNKINTYTYDLQLIVLFIVWGGQKEVFYRRMDIKKELDEVQKKINEIKKSQETLKKIADLQEKQDKKMAKRPHSGPYEMMWYNTY